MEIVADVITYETGAVDRATRLREAGDFQAAVRELSKFWSGPGYEPALSGLTPETAASVLFLAGSLTDHLGSAAQLANSQELAKNLLTRAIERFRTLGLVPKLIDSHAALAVCYWRGGSFSEARAILRSALTTPGIDNGSRLVAMLNLGIVEYSAGELSEALVIFSECAELLSPTTSHFLWGVYHMNFALALNKSGEMDKALIENSAGIYHFEKSGHHRYQARVLNNLAMLLMNASRFHEAKEYAQRAERIFRDLKEPGNIAQVLDTRAMIHLAAAEYDDAEQVACQAVQILENGDEKQVLVDARVTRGKSLLKLRLRGAAMREFCLAVETAETFLGEAAVFRVLSVLMEETVGPTFIGSQIALETAVDTLEARIIREALEIAGGRMTSAASFLQTSHQALDHILENRHQSLKAYRAPRRKSPSRGTQKVVKIR